MVCAEEDDGEVTQIGSLQLLNAIDGKQAATTSKRLMYVEIIINGEASEAMVDTGETYNFITEDEVLRLGLELSKGREWLKTVNAERQRTDNIVKGANVQLGPWEDQLDFSVAPMEDFKVVLGMDFFDKTLAYPIHHFNSLCILEEGRSCLVPVTRVPRGGDAE